MTDTDRQTMQIVLQVGEMSFEGNIIPQSWFEHLKYPSGKPYLTAIMILSEIVYWFRPREIRDERTGRPISYEKRFKGDALQRSYESFANQFGFTKREATDAIKYLVSEGVIRTDLRTVTFDNKFKFPNVMFITVVPARLREITHGRRPVGMPAPRTPSAVETGEVVRRNGGQSSVSTEDGIRQDGRPSDSVPEDLFHEDVRYPDGQPEQVPPLDVATSRGETDTPPPANRNTNTENIRENMGETADEIPPPDLSPGERTLPYAARGDAGRRRFPQTVELAGWVLSRLGRPMCDPATLPDELEAFEEALDRLDGYARACGQTAAEVITTRIWLRPEVQALLREAAWPYNVIARQVGYAMEDYAARAARQKPVPAAAAPIPSRRRPREKPAWMSDDEWAFISRDEK